MSLTSANIAFIRARWHAEIVDQALEGFKAEASTVGLTPENISVFDVPGAFEMPFLAKQLAATNQFDAIVAAAWVVDGGIYRHDFVAAAVVDGLMEAQLTSGVPVFSVSLTPHQYQETDFHNEVYIKHMYAKGQEAARAVSGQLQTLAAVKALA